MRLSNYSAYSYLPQTSQVGNPRTNYHNLRGPKFSGKPSLKAVLETKDPEKLTKALQDGADINEKYLEYCKGQSFFRALFGIDKPVYNEMTGLHMAVEGNRTSDSQNIQKCLQILLNHGLNINAREGETKWTALHRHMYQWNPDPKVTRFLLDKGIDINAKDKYKKTALHEYIKRAFCTPQLPIVKILVENGANIHAKDDTGKTALHYLAQNSNLNLDIVQYLIAAGKTPQDRLTLKQDFLSHHQKYLEHNMPTSSDSKPTKQERQHHKAQVIEVIEQLKQSLSVEKLPESNNLQTSPRTSPSNTNSTNQQSKSEGVSGHKPASDKSPPSSSTPKSANVEVKNTFQNKFKRLWQTFCDSVSQLTTAFLNLFRTKPK